jgi:hypothetical protein
MSVILLEKDPFVELDQTFQDDPYSENANVRRPIYGMTLKEPRFAYISLYQDLGEENATQVVSIIDSSAPGGFSDANHNFILQGVSESRQEKVQIIETFGDHFAFFYGQKPIVLQVQGMLFNSADFNWKNEFLANYERLLRGTKCVENRTRVFLGWDDVVAQGYMLNVQIQYNKDMPLVVPFSFSLLLTKPPLDLSDAAEPLDNPQPGRAEPWTYRALGVDISGNLQSEELGNEIFDALDLSGSAFLPEYLTPLEQSELIAFDPATGEAKVVSGTSGDGTDATDSVGSSPWITGTDPGQKMWNDESEALLRLNTLLAQQQTGADRTTTILAFKKDPAAFQLSKRDTATTAVLASLGTGVAHSMAVVDDAPDVE